MYSEKVMEHFRHPRNVGEMESPDGTGRVGNPVCGDIMELYIKVKDGVIIDAKFQTFGCGAAMKSKRGQVYTLDNIGVQDRSIEVK
jgi:nitrogen fixation NifU-like protein